MVNSFDISVSKECFLAMSEEDQKWMMFEAISQMNNHGCKWSRGYEKRLYIVAAGSGIVGGAITVLLKWGLSF